MAEALGIAASVIAVIQLTTSVTKYCYKYISTVKTAPIQIEKLATELSVLNILLQAIKSEITKGGGSPHTQSYQVALTAEIDKILPQYEQELRMLLLKFHKRLSNVARRALSRFTWPIKAGDIEREIERFQRYKDLFQFALTVDIAKMTRVIEIYSRNTDQSVREILSAVEKDYTIQRQREAREAIDRLALKRKEIFKWLFHDQWDIKHTDIRKKQHPGTGLWLLRHPQFRTWESGTEGAILCGFGIPGAGKTVMSSIVIDHIQDRIQALRNCSLGYIYFSYHGQSQKSYEKVLRSLIQQLWDRATSPSDRIPEVLQRLYDKYNHRFGEPSVLELEKALIEIKNGFTAVYFVFDALDECNEHTQRKHLLRLFASLESGNGKIFITSRPHIQDIIYAAEAWNSIIIEAKQEDVRLFLNDTIQANRAADRMIRGKLRVFVVSSLVRDCKGMFLLAQLYIEHLCQQTTESQVRKAMEKLKSTVKTGSRNALLECYGNAIDRIREQSPSRVALAWKVLGWLVETKLKPSIDDLRAVVSVDNDMTKITEADMPETGLLVEVCAGLVTVEQSSNSVQLAHYTVEEYMENITVAEMSLAPGMILMSSINYLRMTGGLSDTITSYILRTLDHNVVNCNQDRSKNSVISFLKSVFYKEQFLKPLGPYSPLRQACWWSHAPCVEHLIDNGEPANQTDLDSMTPLTHALLTADEKVINMLFEKEGDILKNDLDCNESSYMEHWASYWDPGAQALGIAGHLGDRRIFELLQRRGRTVYSAGKYRMSGIQMIIRLPQAHVEPWVRAHPPQQYDYRSVVRAAITSNNSRMEKHCAVVDTFEDLVRASVDDRIEVLKHDVHVLLTVLNKCISLGEDIEGRDYAGCTALHVAVFEGSSAIVKALLRRSADVGSTDMYGNTPLHLAVSAHTRSYPVVSGFWREREEIARTLLDGGSDVTSQNMDGMTPLHIAVSNENSDIVKTLLAKGADVLTQDSYGMTPLHLAAARGTTNIVDTLLSEGADVLSQNSDGMTSIHLAVSHGWIDNVEALLSGGADIHQANAAGTTPLHTAVTSGDVDITEALLSRGADVHGVNKDGVTPLHIAVSGVYFELAGLLLSRGANVLSETSDGETALMIVRRKKDEYSEKPDHEIHTVLYELEKLLLQGQLTAVV